MTRTQLGLPLGDLELAVMEHLWLVGSCDVKSAFAAMRGEGGRSLNTVQSTLERLARKGLLARHKRARAFVYTPTLSREALLLRTTSQIAESLGAVDTTALMSAFVDYADGQDRANLDRLQALIDARRADETDHD